MAVSKVERVRTKPKVTNIDRARVRKRKPVPEFLKTREPDDRCEAYRVPPPFRQPDVSPAPSGILYPNGYKHRDYVPRDQTRTGLLLCILSGVVMGCIIAAVAS